MSQITKRALAEALKRQLEQHPLERITVKDLTDECGLNRQTFYYHFQDIYDLLGFTFKEEAERTLGENRTYESWQEGFLNALCYVQSHRRMVENAYHSIGREHLEAYLYSVVFELLMGVLDGQAQGMRVSQEDRRFIVDFYMYAFVGVVLEWIRSGQKEEPRALTERLGRLIEGDFKRALEKFSA